MGDGSNATTRSGNHEFDYGSAVFGRSWRPVSVLGANVFHRAHATAGRAVGGRRAGRHSVASSV